MDTPSKAGHFDGIRGPAEAIDSLLDQLGDASFVAAGHRIVHGGPYRAPVQLSPALREALRELIPLAPNHLPGALAVVDALCRRRPELTQVACFDTAFHRSLEPVARRFPLPRALAIERYGFHGLSCEGIVRDLGPAAAGRLIIAHLGNGCSMTAVKDGRSVDTTMGLTPLGGLVMGTRSGDLDPGILLHLLREKKMSIEDLDDLLARKSGLLGVSEVSSDMRDLLASPDPRATEAVALFCHQALKHAGGMAAVLGGLDTLVFTGGIGENAAPIRARLCDGLDFLGVRLDSARNAAHAPLISADDSPVDVRVMPANEERVIARHVFASL